MFAHHSEIGLDIGEETYALEAGVKRYSHFILSLGDNSETQVLRALSNQRRRLQLPSHTGGALEQ